MKKKGILAADNDFLTGLFVNHDPALVISLESPHDEVRDDPGSKRTTELGQRVARVVGIIMCDEVRGQVRQCETSKTRQTNNNASTTPDDHKMRVHARRAKTI